MVFMLLPLTVTWYMSASVTCFLFDTGRELFYKNCLTINWIAANEKSPKLDDGGTGFPPRDDDGGGGGGGGGGGNWSGGFFLFGFLAFLGFLKDKESESKYRDSRRRWDNILQQQKFWKLIQVIDLVSGGVFFITRWE